MVRGRRELPCTGDGDREMDPGSFPFQYMGLGSCTAGALGAAGQGMSKLWEHLGTASSQMEIWLHFPEGHVGIQEGWAAVHTL